MIQLCAPAIIYLIFSLTQILIDSYKGLYNTAIMKVIVMIMVTLLLNILCEQGLSIISWIIVFIPFILMTFIVSVLLYVFGLDASTGELKYKCGGPSGSCSNGTTVDNLGNIIVYDPNYDPSQHPVYYKSPNIIVPNPANYSTRTSKSLSPPPSVPYGSSSPAYQS